MNRAESWLVHRDRIVDENRFRRYVCLAAPACVDFALNIRQSNPDQFKYLPISWEKFPDGTDNITIAGYSPKNEIAGEHILFFASFANNDITLSQISVFIVLLQSFIESLTIVLPFYPVGTMERVDVEGRVATANTYSTLLSSLPCCGRPTRIMIYDIHTLQNRFYFHGSLVASLHTAVPLLLKRLQSSGVQAVVFPDDGAAKRFGILFKDSGLEKIVCGKVRDGDKRRVTVQDGDPRGKEVVIVDDLVQSGGTLYECAMAVLALGATRCNAYATHAVFPNGCWRNFCRNSGASKAVFHKFWLTNSCPAVTNALPDDDAFEVIDLTPQILQDLRMDCS